MKIQKCAFGEYQTNAYVLQFDDFEFVVDPGFNAIEWVLKNTKNLQAILITHGHFDHIWDNAALKKEFNIPLYIHKNDAFFLNDPFHQGFEKSEADVLIENEENLELFDTSFKFHFFPGHTPGCCMIEVVGEGVMFSGDFLFYRSIGRWDFPYSNATLMKQSLEKVLNYKENFKLLPGHGGETMLKEEQEHLPTWLRYF